MGNKHSLHQRLTTGGNFVNKGTLGNRLETCLGVTTGLEWVEARAAAKHPPCTGRPPEHRRIHPLSIVQRLRNLLSNDSGGIPRGLPTHSPSSPLKNTSPSTPKTSRIELTHWCQQQPTVEPRRQVNTRSAKAHKNVTAVPCLVHRGLSWCRDYAMVLKITQAQYRLQSTNYRNYSFD